MRSSIKKNIFYCIKDVLRISLYFSFIYLYIVYFFWQMGSGICKCASTSEVNLIHLSNPQRVLQAQTQRDPDTDIRQTISSYIGTRTSLILGCKAQQRRKLLNKYLLTYLFFIKNQHNTLGLDITKTDLADIQIKDFTKLLIISDKHNQFLIEISQFQRKYISNRNLKDKADFLIAEYFKDGFFSASIQKFPIYSTDPTILGYLRRPIIDLHNRISSKYKEQPKKKEIYCVIQILKDEETLINKMAFNKDHLTFSTFVRCFSNVKKARDRLKDLRTLQNSIRVSQRPNIPISTIFLNINIQKKVAEDYDYGFFQDESQKDNPFGDIIMNIFNFFEVTEARPTQHQYDLNYGSLAKMIHLRRNRQLKGSPELLKVMDVIEGQIEEIKTHSSLIRHIAERNLSITASNSLKNYEFSAKTKGDESINLIEAYLQERNFNRALQECQGKTSLQFQVRKAQILYQANRQSQAQEILNKLTSENKKTLLKENFKEYVLCQFISSKIKKRRGDRTQGKKQLQGLRDVMKKQYAGKYQYRGREVQKQMQSYYDSGSSILVNWQGFGEGLNIGVLATR